MTIIRVVAVGLFRVSIIRHTLEVFHSEPTQLRSGDFLCATSTSIRKFTADAATSRMHLRLTLRAHVPNGDREDLPPPPFPSSAGEGFGAVCEEKSSAASSRSSSLDVRKPAWSEVRATAAHRELVA